MSENALVADPYLESDDDGLVKFAQPLAVRIPVIRDHFARPVLRRPNSGQGSGASSLMHTGAMEISSESNIPRVLSVNFAELPAEAKTKVDVMLVKAETNARIAEKVNLYSDQNEWAVFWLIKRTILRDIQVAAKQNKGVELFSVLSKITSDPFVSGIETLRLVSYVNRMWNYLVDKLKRAD